MKKTIIFMGNSGCGKGTQADLLEKKIKNSGGDVLHIELGDKFRDFLSTTTFTAKKAKEIAKRGQLQPEFLAISLWGDILKSYYSSEKSLLIDGTPRTIREAHVLDSALKFYEITDPIVIYLKTSREITKERMLSRARADDTDEKIENRLNWFEEDVLPAVHFFQNNSYYNYIEIDGSETIEKIHNDIISKVFSNLI